MEFHPYSWPSQSHRRRLFPAYRLSRFCDDVDRAPSFVRKPTTSRAGRQTMKKTKSGSKEGGESPSQATDARIKELNDWRGETIGRIRRLIKEADPEVVEEVKWRKPSNSMLGVPVWSHAG